MNDLLNSVFGADPTRQLFTTCNSHKHMQNTMEMGVNLIQIRVFFMAKEANKLFTCYMYLNLSVTEIM